MATKLGHIAQKWSRPEEADLGFPAAAFWESGLLLLRAPTITGLPGASTSGRFAPIAYENPLASRTHFPPISSPTKPRVMHFKKSLTRSGVLRALRYSRSYRHTQGQVRQLPADHAEPHWPDAHRHPRRARAAWQCSARTPFPGHQGHSTLGCLTVVAH